MAVVLFSNNSLMRDCALPVWEMLYLSGLAKQVVIAARDRIHQGWRLTHHPLYGNFRPNHQPYRSLLLVSPNTLPGDSGASIDANSLHLIEEALGVYQCVPGLMPDEVPPALAHDCAVLDFELMRVPLMQAGWHGDHLSLCHSGTGLRGDECV